MQLMNRRGALTSLVAASSVALTLPPTAAQAETTSTVPADPLETIAVGNGKWKSLDRAAMEVPAGTTSSCYSPSFCTYAARVLIRYDPGVGAWWNELEASLALVTAAQRQEKLGRTFGALAKSLEQGLLRMGTTTSSTAASAELLYDRFVASYGAQPDARRQIALLFALLPRPHQPVQRLQEYYDLSANNLASSRRKPASLLSQKITESSTTTTLFGDNLTQLLPPIFHISKQEDSSSRTSASADSANSSSSSCFFTIQPALTLYEVGIGQEFGQAATATAFGPLASQPLTRELPTYPPSTYLLFGLAGATGCALTHSVVIPLDVVKTRAQTGDAAVAVDVAGEDRTDKGGGGGGGGTTNMLAVGRNIVETEGLQGLLLGAQATVAGYFWYGLSVYPSYTFAKRFLTHLDVAYAVAHANEIALVAGAMAAVVASLGLTPLEAARIRVVAEPDRYRPLGLTGTIAVIARENAALGWTNLYAGLPSLLTRQVIFGSVKFLAFERACESIFAQFPVLRDATWTSLLVSLVAGGLSGVLSSVVSQPADSVLTYVAKGNNNEEEEGSGGNLGLLDGARQMVAKDGPGSLFRGLGSRCVWAGSIIAGQFLLYDVFRTFFGVNADDLSQIYQLNLLPPQ